MAAAHLLNNVLLLQGAALVLAGVLLHYSPQTLAIFVHSDSASLDKDTISVMKGWGSTLLALGAICFQLRPIQSVAAKKFVARGLVINWGLLAYGQYSMLIKPTVGWSSTTGVVFLLIEIVMCLLNMYVGVFAEDVGIRVAAGGAGTKKN